MRSRRLCPKHPWPAAAPKSKHWSANGSRIGNPGAVGAARKKGRWAGAVQRSGLTYWEATCVPKMLYFWTILAEGWGPSWAMWGGGLVGSNLATRWLTRRVVKTSQRCKLGCFAPRICRKAGRQPSTDQPPQLCGLIASSGDATAKLRHQAGQVEDQRSQPLSNFFQVDNRFRHRFPANQTYTAINSRLRRWSLLCFNGELFRFHPDQSTPVVSQPENGQHLRFAPTVTRKPCQSSRIAPCGGPGVEVQTSRQGRQPPRATRPSRLRHRT